MKIYTKTGDKGFTSLIGGMRVPKHHLRIEAYGTIDELNSYLGLIANSGAVEEDQNLIKEIQDRLFTIGSVLAFDPEKAKMNIPDLHLADIELLENEIDSINAHLPALKHFILPGGSALAAHCHVARCICRRAERSVVQLNENSDIDKKIIMYLNRLSDYLFILARKVNFNNKIGENIWLPRV